VTASNLQEIYSACHHRKAEKASLVPSLFSQRVYHTSFGWGRLWKWFYLAVRFLSGKDLKTNRLIKVMQKTEAVFSKRLALVVEHANAYKSYLDKKIRDEEVDEKEVHTLRKSVRRWTRATAPLATDVDKGQNKKISDLFQTYYPDSIEEGKHPFSYGEDADLIKEAQLFIDLEGYLHQPLPLPLLKSLARKRKLTPDEKHELEQWVEVLNRKKKQIPLGLFLDCLKSLTDKPSFGGRLIDLEVSLLENGLELLHMSEKEHMSWRNSLQPGDELESSDQTYRLGNPIGLKDEGFDTNLIFEIEGDPDHVIAIGMNRAYWPVKEIIAKEYQWGVEMPAIKEISPDGRFAVIEKLSPSIVENQWKSPENTPLIHADISILKPIANLFRWWGRKSICPSDFSLDYLMFNGSDELRYTHSLQPQPFNFRLLEDLAHEISQGNLNVYIYLMKESTLANHVSMNFYRKVVEIALDDKPLKVKNVAACRKVTDPEMIRRGKALYKEIHQLRAAIIKTLNREFDDVDEDYLLAEANKELQVWYNETCSASRIWPTIEASVTRNLRRLLQVRQCSMAARDLVTAE